MLSFGMGKSMWQRPIVGFIPAQAPPMVIQPAQFSPGIECCGRTICTCIHLGFLKTYVGWLKLIELILCLICQSLILRYGIPNADLIGNSVNTFLTISSACLLLILLLIFSYLISGNSLNLIRASVLEVAFNCLACLLYLVFSVHLALGVETYLAGKYRTEIAFTAYPALTSCYVLGFVVSIVHGIDAFLNLRYRSKYDPQHADHSCG